MDAFYSCEKVRETSWLSDLFIIKRRNIRRQLKRMPFSRLTFVKGVPFGKKKVHKRVTFCVKNGKNGIIKQGVCLASGACLVSKYNNFRLVTVNPYRYITFYLHFIAILSILVLVFAGCMLTHGGTSQGACCMFPFIYQGVPQHRCTRAKRSYRWCSTTTNYDADNQWGFCPPCFLSYGGNSNGNCCHFPFIYGGKIYMTCTTQDDTRPWCASTYNYDRDKQWGYCGGEYEYSKVFYNNYFLVRLLLARVIWTVPLHVL